MPTLTATSGGTTSNSYVATVAEADSIVTTLGTLVGLGVDTSGWSGKTDAEKISALIMAAQTIDQVPFHGYKSDDDQTMQFPRQGCRNPIDEDEIPDAVKNAQCAEACSLFASTVDPVARAIARGVTSESAGGVSFTVGGKKGNAASYGVTGPAFDILNRAGLVRSRAASVYNPRG